MEQYSYTNSNGERIEVSEEHINTAIHIKKELQKASPSFRCSWTTHKKYMEKDGFKDSENSERYRQFIKYQQKLRGELDSVQTRVNDVVESKLQSIKEAVGEIAYTKKEIQKESQKLRKVSKNLIDTAIVSEEIRNAFINDIDWNTPTFALHNRVEKSNHSQMIVVVSDWHIGAVIKNSNGNDYNFEIAKERIQKLYEEIIEYAYTFGVTDIVIANIGDMVEGLYMRNFNQPFEAEYNLSEQISKATKLLLDFILLLSNDLNVKYFGIAGNHDRWFFEKNTVDSDNVMKIINESIKTVLELSKIDRVEFIEVQEEFNYEKTLKVGTKTFKFIHGDNEGKNMNIDKHSSLEREEIDCLVMGHYHSHKVEEGNYGKLNIVNGSLMGRNSYSRKFKASSNASQTIIIVDGEKILPLRIDLQ